MLLVDVVVGYGVFIGVFVEKIEKKWLRIWKPMCAWLIFAEQ
jgi:hypothetical protein